MAERFCSFGQRCELALKPLSVWEKLHFMHNLPAQLTVFVGRAEEIAEIHNLLHNPDCRMLTLVGVGGIGKTRLALQAASRLGDYFAHGVCFVAIQPVTSIPVFISTVADAIGYTLSGSEDAQAQLLKYITNKELLLLIDNFEHLLHGANLLTELLEAAPRVKLLVTSREPIQLQEEWVYAIEGLDYPRGIGSGDAKVQEYSAVQLFVERARRMRRSFSLEAEAADVLEICQMVEGMPLALELAAAWTQSLSCRAIAAEIRNNLDFLATEWRNVPDRQRSMRAVFDHARSLLSPAEQEVFRRMSVFRGGFHRRAAEFVAGASLSHLGSLVSHCLLRWDPAGRYQLHELLRQYADELLRESAAEKAEIDERHCVYYTDFLYKRLPNMIGQGQLEAIREIEVEVENIRVAWHFALEARNFDALGKAVQTLALFYESRSRDLEGIKLFEEAIEQLHLWEADQPDEMMLAIRFQEVAWCYIRMGQFEKAGAIQKRVQFCYEQLGILPLEGPATDPLLIASILATIGGEYEAAVRYGKQALHTAEVHPHRANQQYTYYVLASAALAQGHYQDAQQYAESAYATAQEAQDRWFMAYCLVEMGNVALALQDYAAARKHLEASYAIRKEYNDPEGMAVALAYLGEVALYQGQFDEAHNCYEHSVALYLDINDRGGLARSLDGVGNARLALGDFEGACKHLTRALELAAEIQFVSLMCTIITSVGNLLVQTGNPPRGIALMAQISRHPSSTTRCKDRARLLLAQASGLISQELYEFVTTQDDIESVTTLAEKAQVELAALDFTAHPFTVKTRAPSTPAFSPSASSNSPERDLSVRSTPPSDPQPDAQPLIDPLTSRELEILNLIVNGLSNQQIATALFITRGTVKWYTSQIYSKLGIDSRTQAIGRARELSLVP